MPNLDRYRQLRNRGATPEPMPEAVQDSDLVSSAAGGGIFVIQRHRARRLHWDFRLERDGVLVSWAVPKGPPEEPGPQRLAVRTEDHPLAYAGFAGDIPRGEYGAGHVDIWDEGTYLTHKWDDYHVEVTLVGRRLHGRYRLIHTSDSQWLLRLVTSTAPVVALELPELSAPMLAVAGPLPADPHDDEAPAAWAYEFKWDGVRALVAVVGGAASTVRARGRNATEIAGRYPELRQLADAVGPRALLLDGELVAFDAAGRPSFGALQRRMHLREEAEIAAVAAEVPVTYLIFDLLHLDGRSLLDEPYRVRRELLESVISPGPAWLVPPSFTGEPGQGAAVRQASVEQALEGVVAKRLESRYLPGKRSPNWIKTSNIATQEVVIAGWREGAGRLKGQLGALLLGVDGPDGLTYVGDVGTGFTDTERAALTELLRRHGATASPFQTPVPDDRAAGVHWVSPTVVGEVQFASWTDDGRLRHASWRGLRSDKAPEQASTGVVDVRVGDRHLRLSNLDKLLYPDVGLTKAGVIEYYQRVAPVLLPHLAGRPVSMFRCPDGVDGTGVGKAFFDKNARRHAPDWLRTVAVSMSEQTQDHSPGYAVLTDVAGLVWAANLAALELHIPQWKVGPRGGVHTPDLLVFDLDPGEPANVVDCCAVALWLRERLAADGLDAVVKTSGSKGLQVYSPVATTRAEQTRTYARKLAAEFTALRPDQVTDTMTRSRRAGKVFVDWSQNNPAKTTVAPYSLRARAGASVSTPITWREVEACRSVNDLVFDYRDVVRRIDELSDVMALLLVTGPKLPS